MHPDNDKYIESIILRLMEDKYVSSDEAEKLKTWLEQNPSKRSEFYSLSVIWTKLDTQREVNNKVIENKWKNIRKHIRNNTKAGYRLALNTYQKYAAIFLLGALLPSLVLTYQVFFKHKKMLSQVISVPYGAKSNISLPDGSEIILNAGSKINYDANYGKKERRITLKGEAYFKVAKNKKSVFIVETKDITVKAYGTEFNVKCYDNDNSTEATLIKGSIGVKLNDNTSKKEYFLKPKEQFIYKHINRKGSGHGNLIIAKNVNTNLYTSWIKDKIQVKSVTLKELAIKLQRKYNVTIHIEDKNLEKLKFTGILENETIEQILQVLELSAKIKYRIDDREIWLYN
jgi:ferric-dicitrate binding protein FerR (iron transport regulator)